MGHQESPHPRQRHRVPHHRRRRHHHNHHPATRTANGKPALNLGRLNRESHAPGSHAVVESWLGQLTAPVSTPRLVSPEPQNQPIHQRKRQYSQERHIFPSSQNPRRVDPLWRPQHIPPAQGSSPPRFPLSTNRERNSKRYKQNSHDSSLIGDLSPCKEVLGLGYIEATSEYDESSHHEPLDGAEVGTTGHSSPKSHQSTTPIFERRPRHKTKADKYDIKKSGDCKRREKDENYPRRSKRSKRGPIVTGKNVMKNFTSEAVFNDRITVQANMKPGLFNNKRVPKEHVITDLSFSEMPFPIHQEHDIPQQKGLSSSRLRERRRESRELEQISSFFLSARADTTSRKEKLAKFKCNEEASKKRLCYRDKTTSGFYQDPFTTPSSPTSLKTHCQRSSVSFENLCPIPNVTPGDPDFRPNSSGTTTYFTWPSSRDSPQPGQYTVDTRPRSIEPAESVIPENIQDDLVTTGVYKDTGIYPYDVSSNQQTRAVERCGESSSTRSIIIHHVKTSKMEESRLKSRCSNDTGATMALPTYLKARWNEILPPEWRPRRSSEVEVSLGDELRGGVTPDITTCSGPLTRQEIVKQTRITPILDVRLDQDACRHKDHDSGTSPHSTTQSPIPVPSVLNQIVNYTTLTDEDGATISSRDAMPPPPVPPPRLNSPRFSNLNSGDNSDSPICIGSARQVGTYAQVPNREHEQEIDANIVVGKERELSREPEKVIPTLDTASWIPQAVTSGIASYERGRTLSRLNMKSPIYETQGRGKDPQGTPDPTPPPKARRTESMADFIARIESELVESESLDEYCHQEPIVESQEFPMESIIYNDEMQSRQLMASDGPQVDGRQFAADITDLGSKRVIGMNRSFHGYEESAAPVRYRSTMMFTEYPGDDIDDFLEMSEFWRPNRFSHF
ncbi:hypothetical protein F4859DRAFT_197293 [Xylaria cf. heliscus]|nr:hypothetical protein F4859DRAFT_197293 [Xylaria cf. heliscus]